MNKLKKFLLVFLTVIILASLSIQYLYASNDDIINSVDSNQIIKPLLDQWEMGIEKKDKDLYIGCFDKYMGNSISKALERDSDLPYFITESIDIKKVVEISKEDLTGVYEIDIWPELGDIKNLDYHIFYFYYNAVVKDGKDSRGVSTGENFYFCVVTKQEGEWKISQLSCAPEERFLIEKGINLGSNKEASLLCEGIENVDEYLRTSHTAPTHIRVMMRSELEYNSETNYEFFCVYDETVVEIMFEGYVKDVLPNEWDSDDVVLDKDEEATKLYDALRAGGIMVRNFGWYHTLDQWNPSENADVNDDSSQVYLHYSHYKISQDGEGQYFYWGTMCVNAVDYTDGNVAWYTSSGYPLWTSYNQTTQNTTYSLDVSGYSPYEIVDYIYSGSLYTWDTY